MAFRMSCTKWKSVNLVKTCLRVPSVWIIKTECSDTCNCEWIHSCISKVVSRGLVKSKQQARVFRLSLIVWTVVGASVGVFCLWRCVHDTNKHCYRCVGSLHTQPFTIAADSELGDLLFGTWYWTFGYSKTWGISARLRNCFSIRTLLHEEN